jgi:hypothetical protein
MTELTVPYPPLDEYMVLCNATDAEAREWGAEWKYTNTNGWTTYFRRVQ